MKSRRPLNEELSNCIPLTVEGGCHLYEDFSIVVIVSIEWQLPLHHSLRRTVQHRHVYSNSPRRGGGGGRSIVNRYTLREVDHENILARALSTETASQWVKSIANRQPLNLTCKLLLHCSWWGDKDLREYYRRGTLAWRRFTRWRWWRLFWSTGEWSLFLHWLHLSHCTSWWGEDTWSIRSRRSLLRGDITKTDCLLSDIDFTALTELVWSTVYLNFLWSRHRILLLLLLRSNYLISIWVL